MKLLILILLSAACFAQQVRFPVVILDRDERFIKSLNASDFHVVEDGVEQTVQGAEISTGGISMGIVIDRSMSMRRSGLASKDSLLRGLASTVDQCGPGDEFFVMLFAKEALLACDFTQDPDRLIRAFSSGDFQGRTALWDALFETVTHLDHARNIKRAVFLISDGRDNASQTRPADAAKSIWLRGTPIFVLNPSSYTDPGVLLSQQRDLQQVAVKSGGWYREAVNDHNIGAYVVWIRDFLRAQYTITYTPTKPGTAGKWRNVRVKVAPQEGRKGLKVVAPSGYYFPSSPGR